MQGKVIKFQARVSGMAEKEPTYAEMVEAARRKKEHFQALYRQAVADEAHFLAREKGESNAALEGIEHHLSALSANTRKGYTGEIKRANRYFDGKGEVLDDESLAEYLLWRHNSAGHAPASIRFGVNALVWRARKMGEPSPFGEVSKSVLKRISREGRDRGRGEVVALLREDLETMVKVCKSAGTLWGHRDAALFALSFSAGLRVSEASAVQVDDIQRGRDGRYRITIRASKTDQTGVGAVRVITNYAQRLIREWLEVSGITSGHLFRAVKTTGVQNGLITTRSIRRAIVRRAKQAGISGRVAGHSFRRGMAQEMALAGQPIQNICTAGRWESPVMVMRYLRGVTTDSFIDSIDSLN